MAERLSTVPVPPDPNTAPINKVIAEYLEETLSILPHHEDPNTWIRGCLLLDEELPLVDHPVVTTISFRKIPGYGFGLPSIRTSPSADIDRELQKEDAYVAWIRYNKEKPGSLLEYKTANGETVVVRRVLSQFYFSKKGHQFFFHPLVGLSEEEKQQHEMKKQKDRNYELSVPVLSGVPREGEFREGSWHLVASDPLWYEFLFTTMGQLHEAHPEKIPNLVERLQAMKS